MDGTYVQRGFLPRWLATFVGVAAALALTFVAFWMAHKPTVTTGATERVVAAAATLTPAPSPALTPPPPTASPAQSPKTHSADSGGAKATTAAKPPQDTAATAVNRLAADDPSGRHICYRVFLAGDGWQPPVCDGTMAGTTDQEKPITSINIAVYGVAGSAANAFVHDPASTNGQPKWQPTGWTAVIADGKDNYIGSSAKDAPNMSGFGINVGSGRICQIDHINAAADWGAQSCDGPRGAYNFGGTLINSRWLSAVKFTVPEASS